MIEFRTLGTLGLTSHDGREIRSLLSQPKRLALLIYLATARPHGFHRRDAVLALFWADSDEALARNALRQALHYLRRSLGPNVIVTRGDDELGLDFERLRCDAVEFLAALDAGESEAALELYAGELLPGFYVDDSAGFERWLDEERNYLRLRAAEAAHDLSGTFEASGDLAGAVGWARKRAEILPHDEDALRRLIELMDQSGNRVGALHEYETFLERSSELGSEPSAETRAVAESIRERGDEAPARTPAARDAGAGLASDRQRRPITQQRVLVGTLAGVGAVALLVGALGLLPTDDTPSQRTVVTQNQVTFVGNVAEASVAPRGELLAYIANDADGIRLMVHDLETGSPIEIASSPDFLASPTWSPDGSRILIAMGAGTDYAHLVYPRLGGDPQALPTTGRSRWSRDGRRLYQWGQEGSSFGMFEIDTESHARIQTADTTAWLHDVVPSPSGDRVALVHSERTGRSSSIWLLTIDPSEPFDAMPRDSAGRIVASRYERLVGRTTELYSVTWSPSGRSVYFLQEGEGVFELWKLRVAADGNTRHEPELLMSGLELAVPADPWKSLLSINEEGSRLYFVKGSAYSNVWSMRLRGDTWGLEPLTTGTTTDLGVSDSPDGEWIAYRSTVAGRTNVFVVPSVGGPSRQVTHVDSVTGYPVWSPDGASLAFGLRRAGENRVATAQVDGAARTRVFEATSLSAAGTIAWGPGSEILYQRRGLRSFSFLDPDTEAERPLLIRPDSATAGFVFMAHFSPDGTEVVVLRNRQPRGLAGLYVVSVVDGVNRRLMTDPNVAPMGWSDDGRTVYALSQDRRQVLAVPADGGQPVVVATLPFQADQRAATFDGRWFVFASPGATGDVWEIENFDPEP